MTDDQHDDATDVDKTAPSNAAAKIIAAGRARAQARVNARQNPETGAAGVDNGRALFTVRTTRSAPSGAAADGRDLYRQNHPTKETR